MFLRLRRSMCVILVVAIVITALTACGAKKPQINGTVSLSYMDNFGSFASSADGFTVYGPGGETKLVTAQLLDQNNHQLPVTNSAMPNLLSVSYEGKVIRFNYNVQNLSGYPKTIIFYIQSTSQGYLQPFKVNGVPGDQTEYSFDIAAHSEKKLGFDINPLFASTTGEVYCINTNIENKGYSDSNTGERNPLSYYVQVKSTDKSFDVETTTKTNNIAKEYDMQNGNSANLNWVAFSLPTNGVLDDKIFSSAGFVFNNTDQICLIASPQNNDNTTSNAVQSMRGYLLIDNKPVKAFNGQYYFDATTNKGKYYEINIDKSVIPSSGVHLFTFQSYGNFGYLGTWQITIKKQS